MKKSLIKWTTSFLNRCGYVVEPKALEPFACEREKQIFNEFTGNNHAYLAKK